MTGANKLPPKACYGCDYLGQFSYHRGEILITENNERSWIGCKFDLNPKMTCKRKYEAEMEIIAEIYERRIAVKLAEKEFKKMMEEEKT